MFFIAVLIGFSVSSKETSAVELGLTPSDVVMLWTNTNNALVAVAPAAPGGGAALAVQVKALTPGDFQNKNPDDVLGQVATFRGKLDLLCKRIGLPATGTFANGDGKITPSVVFLNTGFVLNSSAEVLLKISNNSVSAGPYYTPLAVNGKTPTDAFVMAELATRRIDLILSSTARSISWRIASDAVIVHDLFQSLGRDGNFRDRAGNTDGVIDGAGQCAAGPRDAGLARALDADRRADTGMVFGQQNFRYRQFAQCGDQIIGKRDR